jgi:hypothetical protein
MILLKNLFRYCSDFGRIKPAGIGLSNNIVLKNVSSPVSRFPARSLAFILFYKVMPFYNFLQRYEPTAAAAGN